MKPRMPLDEIPLEALITVCAIIGVVVVLVFRRFFDWFAP